MAAGRELRRFPPGDAGPPDVISLPLAATDALQVATVGNVPVVADQTTRTLYLPGSGRTVPCPSTDTSNTLELQQSSTSSSIAVVATTDALYAVDLATGRRTTLSSHQGGNVVCRSRSPAASTPSGTPAAAEPTSVAAAGRPRPPATSSRFR